VHAHARRSRNCTVRQVAREGGRERQRLALRQAVGTERKALARAAVTGQVEWHLEGALDPPAELRRRILLNGGDGERWSLAAEHLEGVVADVKHASGGALGAGDREIPRREEGRALDARRARGLESLRHD